MSQEAAIKDEATCIPYCQKLLESVMKKTPSMTGALMASVDGHAFASAFQGGDNAAAPRIAAMCSSLLALSDSFSNETLKGNTRFNTVTTNRGSIVTTHIPSQDGKYVLSVWADDSDTFAMTLRTTLDTAKKLADLVDRSH